ncbi:MAG TPA: hypothetical protein DDZ39_07805, partial [Flavobacteriaceae bacterium]|nr:hypothetical protein [Flavobacteriaceae bacterium]
MSPPTSQPKDSIKEAEIKTTDKTESTLQLDSIPDLPYSFNDKQRGSLFLNNMSEYEIVYDAEAKHYVFVEKVGDYYIKHPFYMTDKEYEEYRLNRDMLDYFKDKLSAVEGRNKNSKDQQKNLLPKYYVKSSFFENIFGGNEI